MQKINNLFHGGKNNVPKVVVLLHYYQTEGRKIRHDNLKQLTNIWHPSNEIILIHLGSDYYTVKFLKEENMRLALQNGPWFINGFFYI